MDLKDDFEYVLRQFLSRRLSDDEIEVLLNELMATYDDYNVSKFLL